MDGHSATKSTALAWRVTVTCHNTHSPVDVSWLWTHRNLVGSGLCICRNGRKCFIVLNFPSLHVIYAYSTVGRSIADTSDLRRHMCTSYVTSHFRNIYPCYIYSHLAVILPHTHTHWKCIKPYVNVLTRSLRRFCFPHYTWNFAHWRIS